jgi:hypothetical protein
VEKILYLSNGLSLNIPPNQTNNNNFKIPPFPLPEKSSPHSLYFMKKMKSVTVAPHVTHSSWESRKQRCNR